MKSQKEIWRKTISSRSTSTAFAGGTRTWEALEGSIKNNLFKLIIDLSKLEKQDQNIEILETDVTKPSGD